MSIKPTIAYRQPLLPVVPRGRRQVQIALACFALAALGSLYLLGGAGRYLAIGLAGLTAVGLTLWDIRIGLGIFILLAGLSPEFSVFAGASIDNLRAEDLLFPVLLLSWLVRILVHRERPDFRTPLTAPMVAITLWGLAVTLLGVAQGTVPHGSEALFRLAKYTQYYLIFFLVYNNVRSLRDARNLAALFVAAAALTALFSIYRGATAWAEAGDQFARASGPRGENYNTLSGYLLQGFAVAVAAGLSSRGREWRLPLAACALAVAATVLYTHSREGYIMLAATLAFLAGRRYRVLLLLAIAFCIVAPTLLPLTIRERVSDTVYQLRTAQTGSPGSNSMTARLYAWRGAYGKWIRRYPVHGTGHGGVALSVDNEYILRLSETGIPGLCLFLWLLVCLWRQAAAAGSHSHRLVAALGVGAQGALVALLVQGTVAAGFSTIRTMEPFWFLTALLHAAVRTDASAGPIHNADTAAAHAC